MKHPNSTDREHALVFVKNNDFGYISYLTFDDGDIDKPDNLLRLTNRLSSTYKIGNKLENVPDYIKDFSKKNDFTIKEIKIEYTLL